MSVKLLLVFVLTEFLLCLTPGPAVLLIISQAVRAGFKSSLNGVAGIVVGNTIYFCLSALGLGALLLASTTVFQVIKWLGIAYLIVTGIRMLFVRGYASTAEAMSVIAASHKNRPLTLFGQGVLTQLANPKAIAFFTALLPQFIHPGGRVIVQFVVLGVISIAVEFPVLTAYGWLSARGSGLLPARFASLQGQIAGGFLIAAGVGLALTHRP
jgi:homoserine/homoserine lactone efflux protein